MHTTNLLSVGDKNALEAMEAFVLLDLIGSTQPWPNFYDMYHETTDLFQRIVKTGEPGVRVHWEYDLALPIVH